MQTALNLRSHRRQSRDALAGVIHLFGLHFNSISEILKLSKLPKFSFITMVRQPVLILIPNLQDTKDRKFLWAIARLSCGMIIISYFSRSLILIDVCIILLKLNMIIVLFVLNFPVAECKSL